MPGLSRGPVHGARKLQQGTDTTGTDEHTVVTWSGNGLEPDHAKDGRPFLRRTQAKSPLLHPFKCDGREGEVGKPRTSTKIAARGWGKYCSDDGAGSRNTSGTCTRE